MRCSWQNVIFSFDTWRHYVHATNVFMAPFARTPPQSQTQNTPNKTYWVTFSCQLHLFEPSVVSNLQNIHRQHGHPTGLHIVEQSQITSSEMSIKKGWKIGKSLDYQRQIRSHPIQRTQHILGYTLHLPAHDESLSVRLIFFDVMIIIRIFMFFLFHIFVFSDLLVSFFLSISDEAILFFCVWVCSSVNI